MPDKSLGLRISEVIWEHCPGVMEGDLDAALDAAAEVSSVLGCLVALIALDDKKLEKVLMVKIGDTIGKAAGNVRARSGNVQASGHC